MFPHAIGVARFLLLAMCVTTLLACAQLGLAAPPTHYRAELLQSAEGLPHNNITALAQMKSGLLIVGTIDGLARFDGMRFTSIDASPVLEPAKCSVSALCEGDDGSLWVGTARDGLLRLGEKGWSHFTRTNGLPGNDIRALLRSRDGSIWIGTGAGLTRFRDGQFTTLTEADGLTNNLVRSLYEDTSGTLWIAAGYGLNQFKNEKLNRFEFPSEGLPNRNSIKAVTRADDGTLWIGFTAGLASVREGIVNYYRKTNGLVDQTISALAHDHSGNLWIGTFGGLNRFFENHLLPEVNNSGATYDQINDILEDREGNIWLGSREGLYRLTPKPFFTYNRQHGLSHNNVMSIYENKAGHYWIGTWGGGLNWMHDGMVTVYSTGTALTNGLTTDLILGLCMEKKGHLWFGTDHLGGLFQLNRGKFHRFAGGAGITNAGIRVVHQDDDGVFWLGTSSGLVRFERNETKCFTANDGLAGNSVRVIIPAAGGGLWIGTENGLSLLKDGRFADFAGNKFSGDAVLALHLDVAGDLWIGTQKSGLGKMKSPVSGSSVTPDVSRFTSRDGLFSDEVFEIIEDGHGFLWMSSRRGVFRVSKKDLHDFENGRVAKIDCRNYGPQDGMLSVQCNGVAKPGALKTRDGRIWFATIKGIAVVDPNFNRSNSVPPVTVLETVIADKTKVRSDQWHATNHVTRHASPVTVPPGRGEMEFHFAAISFTDPERVRFKYKLEGIDSDWIEAGARRVAHYNNIFPGDYEFRVKACNNDGVWDELGANVKLSLQPHFWQTRGFVAACGIVLLISVGGGARYFTQRRMERQVRHLEQQNALARERSRIAQDLHDEMGARLTETLLLAGLTKKCRANPELVGDNAEKIAGSVQEMIENLRSIVWTVNPRNDSLEELANYLCDGVQSFLKLKAIVVRLEVADHLPSGTLSSEIRHNILLLVKEALNNIVKHSEATEVKFCFEVYANRLVIGIEDNGKGFSATARSGSGNGLENMRRRAENIGGQFTLASEAGKGTRLRISVPLPDKA